MRLRLTGVVSAIALMYMVPSGALAQTAPKPEAPAEASTEASPSAGPDIVVTGSRVARRDYQSSSPIVTVSSDAIAATGNVTLEGALNQLPQFTPDGTAFSNGLNATGQATLNLRGLGAQRNLVLLDGKRLQPSSSTQVVDINSLPTILVGGTEIITGGASAVYGSDANSGVVNFKLRQIEGVEISAQNTITERGDAGIRNISLGAGTHFAGGRGRVLFGIDYTDRDALGVTDRAFFRRNVGVSSSIGAGLFTPSTNGPSQAAINAAFAAYGVPAGAVPRASSIGVNADGTLFSTGLGVYNYRDATPYVNNIGSALLQKQKDVYAQMPLERLSTFGKVSYDLASDVKFYAQGLYADYTAYSMVDAAPNAGVWMLSVPVTNPYIPAALQPLLASRAKMTAPVLVTKRYVEAGPRRTRHDSTTWQALAGFSGRIGAITWDLYGSHGESSLSDATAGSVFADKVQRLVSAPDGGAALCGGYNPFAVTNSATCAAYISGTTTNRTKTTQDVAELTFQGPLVTLPAGEVRFAAGADYRRNSFSFTPDAQQLAGNIVGITRSSGTSGSTRAIEGYAELLVPLLRDLPGIQSLDLDAAYRYSDYDRSGGVSTYKAELNWQVFEPLRLRGGYQRAIRAPNVGELFTASTGLFPTIGTAATGAGDPCDIRGSYRTGAHGADVRNLCLAQGVPAAVIDAYANNVSQVGAYLSGNTDLSPEKADTYTAGAVLTPRLATPSLSALSLSVDYYNISIANAIATIPVTLSLSKCFNGDGSNPTYSNSNYYCSLIGRDPATGGITNALMPYLNIGGYRTSGVDVQLDWSVRLADIGIGGGDTKFGISSVVNYLDTYRVQNQPGSPFQEYGGTIGSGTTLPRWRSTTSFTLGDSRATMLVRWRHIGGMSDFSSVANPASTIAGVPAYDYVDLSFRIDPVKGFGLRFGVNNLADSEPPVVGGVLGTTDSGTYDVLGRTFYMGATVRF
ncbi:TonB-dependent receptor domain-containing protein [Sphingopyxis fribergensis]|nr:TonB-dependent receptor [Sphingopyxis fribergensis]